MPSTEGSAITEATSPVPATKPVSRRCLCCRLPDAVREELVERARIRGWATYAQIAQALSGRGYHLSQAAVRRHLGHTDKNRYFGPDDGRDGSAEPVSTPFDALVTGWISEKAVAETPVRSLLQRMQELERQQRAMRDPASRERLASRHLQTLAALERALKRLAETRKPERDVKKIVAESLRQATVAITETYQAAMHEQIAVVRNALFDLLDKRIRPEDFLGLLKRWEREWPATMANRIGETLILSFRAAGAQA